MEPNWVSPAADYSTSLLRREAFPQAGDESFDSVFEQVPAIEGDGGQRVRCTEHQVEPEQPVQRVREEPEERSGNHGRRTFDLIEVCRGIVDRGGAGEWQRHVRED